MKNKYFWVRMGDGSNYERHDTLEDALSTIMSGCDVVHDVIPVEQGIRVPPYYDGNAYISLFVGDSDAQSIRGLTPAEIKQVKKTIKA